MTILKISKKLLKLIIKIINLIIKICSDLYLGFIITDDFKLNHFKSFKTTNKLRRSQIQL